MRHGADPAGRRELRVSRTVLHFVPRAQLEPQENLDAFVELCRQSEVLGARRQFDENVWDTGNRKGHNGRLRAIFSTMEAASQDKPEPSMPPQFLDFAKAVLVYLQDSRPLTSQAVRISALRYLEASLREWGKGSRPTAVNEEVLDTAVELAHKNVSAGVAYRVAGQLKIVADLMGSKGFITLRQPWGHGLKKPRELGSRISKEAITARQSKMPSAAAIRALGGIFQDAIASRDVLVSSATALMTCAPERINEVLRLTRNCVEKGDGRFAGHVGLRWAGSKGANDTIKWLPTVMTTVAKQAVANLLAVTRPAQEIAAWYTENPTSLYLHEDVAHLRGCELLSPSEIAVILWGDESRRLSANTWAQTTHKLPKHQRGTGRAAFAFKDVEQAVLAMLPDTFPYVPGAPQLLCMDSLAVVRVNEMHAARVTYRCMFTCADYGTIANALARHDGQPSIFDRFGYTEDDGSPIEMNTHSLRHYLNMLAQMGGMSSAEIALFSGRKDAAQNSAYDHMTSDEVQAPISDALSQGFMGGLVAREPRRLVARTQFSDLGATAAHTTDFGYCLHDFASEPCQMHRDCINCEEHECVKGEAHKEANLRASKAEMEQLLEVAKQGLTDDEYGADSWVAHQTKTLERIDSLLSIYEDPWVPRGAQIRLNVTNRALITQEPASQPIHVVQTGKRKLLS